jgi:steroid 5-alpha reductase family enzyme
MLNILYYLLISLLIQIVLFIPAYIFKTDKLTDLSYSLSFIILSLFAFFSNSYNVIKLILLLMINLWAIRLGSYLFYRINKIGRDKRFDEIRNNFYKFSSFWLLQAISVFIILLNSLILFSKDLSFLNFNYLSIVGVFIWLTGLLIESFSDIQKFNYKKNHKNTWTNIGLWKYSRHPNYFGEMLCWVGIFVFSVFYLNVMNILLSLVSPLLIILLLRFVTGIPTTEKKQDSKFKNNKEYVKYKEKTNLLLPIKTK